MGINTYVEKEIPLQIMGFSDHCIHFSILDAGDTILWRGSGIYGWLELSNKFRTWHLMRELATREPYQWVCFGDFNEILYSIEKDGGRDVNDRRLQAFRDCLFDCGLFDMGYRGTDFTWTNCREDGGIIRERLDQFVKTVEWDVLFPNAIVYHLARVSSDHITILLDTESKPSSGGAPFRLKAMWLKDKGCKHVIITEWNRF
ncbi:hypothetical protein M5689_003187 [Euphorbia peplus]|nr:hypothetical protein M5689_003187 [Euphorbia peplus]